MDGEAYVFTTPEGFKFQKICTYIWKYTLTIIYIFICTYIKCVCIFTLKSSLHSNPYSVTPTWHKLKGVLCCILLLSVEQTNSNRYILISAKTIRSLPQWVVISSEQVQVKTTVIWETAVWASQTMQVPWQAAACSWEAAREFLCKKSRSPGKQLRGSG